MFYFLNFIIFKWNIYPEINIDSHIVIRNNRDRVYVLPSLAKWYHLVKLTQYHNQDTDIDTVIRYKTFSPPQGSLMLSFYSHNHYPLTPTPTLVPGSHKCVPHFYNIVISKMLYKWNHTLCKILWLTFFVH